MERFSSLLIDFEIWHPQIAALLDFDPIHRRNFQKAAEYMEQFGVHGTLFHEQVRKMKAVVRTAVADLQGKVRDATPLQVLPQPTGKGVAFSISLFISHSSLDTELAAALVALFRSAYSLPAAMIRCSSVDGYRLPVGVPTDEQLRVEVKDCRVLIGLITPSALRSLYVLFELGARWGMDLPMFPLLARGADPSFLCGPLAGINAVSLTISAQIHQLLEDLGSVVGIKPGNPGTYGDEIEALVRLAKSIA